MIAAPAITAAMAEDREQDRDRVAAHRAPLWHPCGCPPSRAARPGTAHHLGLAANRGRPPIHHRRFHARRLDGKTRGPTVRPSWPTQGAYPPRRATRIRARTHHASLPDRGAARRGRRAAPPWPRLLRTRARHRYGDRGPGQRDGGAFEEAVCGQRGCGSRAAGVGHVFLAAAPTAGGEARSGERADCGERHKGRPDLRGAGAGPCIGEQVQPPR